jgi:Phosphotransferase enzyme family
VVSGPVVSGSVLDDAAISDWCARSLGARVARVLFRSGHLAQVVGAELADGSSAVIKIRPFEPRIGGCVGVQAHLAQAGFPCPALLAGPVRVRGLAVTAERLIDGGARLPSERGAAPFAALLARLVRSAPGVGQVPALAPSPPWTAWDHPGSRLWPDRDDSGRDLNTVPGPGWVEAAARRVRLRMSACPGPPRIGHGDWESQNLRWAGGRARAVHDWDSVIAQPEVAIVGLASAVWPAAGGPADAATVGQSADFIAAYQAAAGIRWDDRQVQDAWAAGLWVRLFNARKDVAAGGGAQLDRLATEIGDRLSLAALLHDG